MGFKYQPADLSSKVSRRRPRPSLPSEATARWPPGAIRTRGARAATCRSSHWDPHGDWKWIRLKLRGLMSSLWRGTFLIGKSLELSFLLILIRKKAISFQIMQISFRIIILQSKKYSFSCVFKFFSIDDFKI
jgi:hypothetical protein